jgi:putative component of toxin-antitoxin plasmid stabilization module
LEALNKRLKGIEGGMELVEDAGYDQWVKNFKMEKAQSKLEQRISLL